MNSMYTISRYVANKTFSDMGLVLNLWRIISYSMGAGDSRSVYYISTNLTEGYILYDD